MMKDEINIAAEVRKLRKARHWTQAELAKQLGLSQSRLSQIERGAGSFTAEQFLTILRLFNVPLTRFAAKRSVQELESEMQNALARLGAFQLQESEHVLPTERLEAVTDVVREALVHGSSRFITALGPVIVRHVDRINLRKLDASLAEAGLERRLAWLVENILVAIRLERALPRLPREWAKLYRRAELVLDTYLEFAISYHRARPEIPAPDILDAQIRSKRTLEKVRASSSEFSQRWGIATDLQPEDFSLALRAARVES